MITVSGRLLPTKLVSMRNYSISILPIIKLASENNITIEAHTVAQLLGQQPELNEATGKEEFVTGDSKIGDYDLIIIDEFSMISEANFNDIAYEVSHRDTHNVRPRPTTTTKKRP